MPVRVESVGPEAAPLVYQLTLDSFTEYRGVLDPPTGVLAESVADVERALAEHEAAVAWIGETAVGSVRLEANANHLYVGRLAVLPAFRRNGAAAALMRFAEERARSLELPVVQVEVRTALAGNIAFFKKLGFVHVATNPHPRKPSVTSEVLAKTVGSR